VSQNLCQDVRRLKSQLGGREVNKKAIAGKNSKIKKLSEQSGIAKQQILSNQQQIGLLFYLNATYGQNCCEPMRREERGTNIGPN
jgi:hypothetical protein